MLVEKLNLNGKDHIAILICRNDNTKLYKIPFLYVENFQGTSIESIRKEFPTEYIADEEFINNRFLMFKDGMAVLDDDL